MVADVKIQRFNRIIRDMFIMNQVSNTIAEL